MLSQMTNLQTIAESMATKCRAVQVIVTATGDILGCRRDGQAARQRLLEYPGAVLPTA